jgi:hypothetical protein
LLEPVLGGFYAYACFLALEMTQAKTQEFTLCATLFQNWLFVKKSFDFGRKNLRFRAKVASH